jgi:hypothetical protein
VSHLACLLALLGSLPQEPAPDPKFAECIDALIVKTNAYEHFAARYRFHGKDGTEGELRLSYRRPDQARLAFGADGSQVDVLVRGTTMEMHGQGKEMAPRCATIRNAAAEAVDTLLVKKQLDEAFPGTADPKPPASADRISFSFAPDEDCANLNFNIGFGGPASFYWLERMRGRLAKLSWAGADHALLEYSPCEDVHVFVSAESGLISRVERQAQEGLRVGLELLEADFTPAAVEKAFVPAPAVPGAQNDTERAESDFARRGFQSGRAALFLGLAKRLDERGLEWSEECSGRVEGILRELATLEVKTLFQPLVSDVRSQIEGLDERVDTELEKAGEPPSDPARAKRELLARARAQLEQAVSKSAECLFEPPYPRERCKARPALSDDLAALEQRVLPTLYAELVTGPLLAEFDQKVAKLLEAK